MKSFLLTAFTKPQSRLFKIVNNFYAVLTILSILFLVLETVPSFSDRQLFFTVVEWVAVVLFLLEYIGRLYISRPILKYSLSFFGMVDLVAIFPTFLGLGNFTFLKSARALRIVRLLRMARLAKVVRVKGVADENFSVVGLNILIYFVTLICALLFTGTLMYLVEPVIFSSIPSGMWWSFKVFMGSVPVVLPETVMGDVLFVVTRFVGLLLLGLLVGVVGNVFRGMLFGENK